MEVKDIPSTMVKYIGILIRHNNISEKVNSISITLGISKARHAGILR